MDALAYLCFASKSPTQPQKEGKEEAPTWVCAYAWNLQRHALLSHAGAARFAYNWGLEVRQKAYAYAGAREDAISLHKLLNSLKAESYPRMYEVSKCAPQEALRDLDKAYEN